MGFLRVPMVWTIVGNIRNQMMPKFNRDLKLVKKLDVNLV